MKKIVSLVAAACALAFVACDKPTESEPTLTVGSTSLTFEAVGSPAQNVGVTSNVEWKCTVAESAAAWLTAVKTDSGDGITVSVTDNGPEQRVGKITVEAVSAKVKAKEITVTQKAGEAVAVEFTLTPDKLEFVGESAPAQEVTVVLDGEGMTWKAAPEADGTWRRQVYRDGGRHPLHFAACYPHRGDAERRIGGRQECDRNPERQGNQAFAERYDGPAGVFVPL